MNPKITIRLSKDIYQSDSVAQTTDAFKQLAQISVTEEADSYLCVFEQCEYDAEQTVKEFENYLIDISNTH